MRIFKNILTVTLASSLVLVAFPAEAVPDNEDIIQSSTSLNGGTWSTPANLSAANGDASYPQVTVSSTGLATAVWGKPVGSNNIIQSSTPTTTTLAATGADLQWLVLGSLLAVVAGAGFFALGRRKRTQQRLQQS
jgi:LPXTG-motif cell wall-anchored protein